MDELNHTRGLTSIEDEGYDTLTITDQGDAISLTQMAEDGVLHDVVIGVDQAEKLMKVLAGILG